MLSVARLLSHNKVVGREVDVRSSNGPGRQWDGCLDLDSADDAANIQWSAD